MKINTIKQSMLLVITGVSIFTSCQKDFLDQVPDDKLPLRTFSRKKMTWKSIWPIFTFIFVAITIGMGQILHGKDSPMKLT